jgi:uncharacterized protein (TIGR02271 family)
MLNRDQFMSKYPDIQEGTTVYCRDGEKLGKITALSDDHFIVEKGIFFPKDFTLRYEDIADYRDGDLYTDLIKADLDEWRNESYAGWSQVDDVNAGRYEATPKPEFKDRYANLSREETRIPVMEEELEATKTMRQTGEVQVRKIVHTELKHFTVPVQKEEVRIERTPVSRTDEAARMADARGAFKESTIKVPVMEEEVTISKRPVVKEEVRITKEQQTEQRDVSGEIRKEEVDIQNEGDLNKKKKIA